MKVALAYRVLADGTHLLDGVYAGDDALEDAKEYLRTWTNHQTKYVKVYVGSGDRLSFAGTIGVA